MKVIRSICILLTACLIIFFSQCSCAGENKSVLFQVSTLNALFEGIYDGEITFQELAHYGDFGIGTFNALDGEMVVLDGNFYQVRVDGEVLPVDPFTKTPFAMVTFFYPDAIIPFDEPADYDRLLFYLDTLLPTENIFYAIKVKGTFSFLKARSVPRQKRPYPPLVQAIAEQSIFEFNNVQGTMVGFFCPVYIQGLNMAGYHFHFISEDTMMGGHVLDCQIDSVHIEISFIHELSLILPKTEDFYRVNLVQDNEKELEKVER
ncbi:acetolactate decarboxylase [Candidatus Aerophobetes bacterium]|nr:acetolactate decarboxylase [Candidatus Aerophobetes bacterium]